MLPEAESMRTSHSHTSVTFYQSLPTHTVPFVSLSESTLVCAHCAPAQVAEAWSRSCQREQGDDWLGVISNTWESIASEEESDSEGQHHIALFDIESA